ncbi:RHS repeat protein [Candidatus Kaiserbacteria bacterium]|nr:RHS repeat protein [Candidatus Kaiserbacteria bacterium]
MKTSTENIPESLAVMWRAYRAIRLYKSFGNITQLANPAAASSSATTVFSYDALNRLLSASTTAADSLPYKQQYEYDTLGSMLALWSGSGTASSTYTYGGTGYANPHAVTEISNGVSTTTYMYDANGNLAQKTTDGQTTTYLWDYANRLTTSSSLLAFY